MHFQLRYIMADFDFGDAQISVTDDVKKMTISLRKRLPEDVPPPIEQGDGVVTVICQREVPDTLVADAGSGKPVMATVEAVNSAYQDMEDYMVRMLRLIRWRANSHGRPNPLRGIPDLSWSFDGVQWKPVLRIAVSFTIVQVPGPTQWTPEAEEFVSKESSGGLDEPLGHELLREAWANRGQNPRSSLVLAVAAAEVGFKQFASNVLPDIAWIMENLPSPPLIEMLAKFPWAKFGQINNMVPNVPKVIIKKLEKAVTLRNKIIHTGIGELKNEAVGSAIGSVRDLLYFLDGLRTRQSWPFSHISHEAQKHFLPPHNSSSAATDKQSSKPDQK